METLQCIRRHTGDESLLFVNSSGSTLHAACSATSYSSLEAVEYLINEVNVPIFTVNENGDTPLHICVRSGANNILLTILQSQLKPFEKDDDDVIPSTITNDEESFIKLLNAQNKQGDTLLHLSTPTVCEKIRQLCNHKYIDEMLENSKGKTSRDIERQARDEQFRL